MRGVDDLPFPPGSIVDVIQTDDDKNPRQRGGWIFGDDWSDPKTSVESKGGNPKGSGNMKDGESGA